MFSNIVVQWIIRRVLELGPWLSLFIGWFVALPPAEQAALLDGLRGNWGAISIGTVISLVGYVWSFRSTRAPQVVTATGKQILKHDLPLSKQAMVEEAADAEKPRTLWERLLKLR